MHKSSPILEQSLERLRLLYIREHLNSSPLRRIVIKPAWNVVIGDGDLCGVSMNFTGFHDLCGYPQPDPAALQRFVGRDLFSVAEQAIGSSDINEVSVGVACMSALSQPLLGEEALARRGFEAVRDIDLGQAIGPQDVVTVVGYGGAVRQFLGRCGELHVTDMRPQERFENVVIDERIERGPKAVIVHPESENEAVLSRSDVVLLTGSAIVNGTFDALLGYCSKARLIVVYGASASFIPDLLLERGVHTVRSHRVSDPERFAYDAINEFNMEAAIGSGQTHLSIRRKVP